MSAPRARGAANGLDSTTTLRSEHAALGLAAMSRAEKFEDEKRRIVDSCFTKREDDGSCTILCAIIA